MKLKKQRRENKIMKIIRKIILSLSFFTILVIDINANLVSRRILTKGNARIKFLGDRHRPDEKDEEKIDAFIESMMNSYEKNKFIACYIEGDTEPIKYKNNDYEHTRYPWNFDFIFEEKLQKIFQEKGSLPPDFLLFNKNDRYYALGSPQMCRQYINLILRIDPKLCDEGCVDEYLKLSKHLCPCLQKQCDTIESDIKSKIIDLNPEYQPYMNERIDELLEGLRLWKARIEKSEYTIFDFLKYTEPKREIFEPILWDFYLSDYFDLRVLYSILNILTKKDVCDIFVLAGIGHIDEICFVLINKFGFIESEESQPYIDQQIKESREALKANRKIYYEMRDKLNSTPPPAAQTVNHRAIYSAVKNGYLGNLKYLMNEHNLNPNSVDKKGETLLELAKKLGNQKSYDFLLEMSTNLNMQNKKTAYQT